MSETIEWTRFWEKVDKSGDCWEWTASLDDGGYGRFWLGAPERRVTKAHKAVWERENGPVPDDLELDHLCHNRKCVRLDHLEPVTHKINVMRGRTPQRFCVNGHDTYAVGRAGRHCRECTRVWARQYRRRQRNA